NLRNLKPNPFHIIRIRTKQQGVEAQKGTRSLVVVNQAATTQVSVTASNVRFRLDNLGPQPGSRKKGKRKGRGISAGQGGSCGFGMRGQKSRSGPGVRKGFEGGQMPLYRRIPKLRGIAGGENQRMILQGRDSDADNALEEFEGFSLLILLGFSFFFFCEFLLKLSCSIRYYGALACHTGYSYPSLHGTAYSDNIHFEVNSDSECTPSFSQI
ncbi:hypothetical protein Gohar_009379, partial [Gossypium harknessii]|nr:hypothetical protein [Gossypium harknessii]